MILKNKLGMTKQVDTGFCWLTLLFGAFVPLFRGMLKEFFLWIAVAVIVPLLFPSPLALIIIIVFYFYMCATMNDKYLEYLVAKGYEPVKEE